MRDAQQPDLGETAAASGKEDATAVSRIRHGLRLATGGHDARRTWAASGQHVAQFRTSRGRAPVLRRSRNPAKPPRTPVGDRFFTITPRGEQRRLSSACTLSSIVGSVWRKRLVCYQPSGPSQMSAQAAAHQGQCLNRCARMSPATGTKTRVRIALGVPTGQCASTGYAAALWEF